ncbi:MAG: pantoate--beta-alanine ligase [Actinomycetota bacterium]
MKVVRTVEGLRVTIGAARAEGQSVGLVPTMGSLHEGHLSLVHLARSTSDVVVVSIFVNPLQFSPGEDFEHYPRDTEGDLELLEGEHADVAFLPSMDIMYPRDATVRVSVGSVGERFEGVDRPGHFDGVCTVVAKLLNLVGPDLAFFGQKDAQQVAVVRRMVRDLDFAVEIVVGPIVREGTGLALSSRNIYLSEMERDQATALSRALEAGARAMRETKEVEQAEKVMRSALDEADGVDPSYAAAVDPDTFERPRPEGRALLIVAARVGPARLIDNLLVEPES